MDNKDYAWLDQAIADVVRRQLSLPAQMTAIAEELTPERGFVLPQRKAHSLVALAFIATPLSLDVEGQAEFIRHYILRACDHSAQSTGLAATEGDRRDVPWGSATT